MPADLQQAGQRRGLAWHGDTEQVGHLADGDHQRGAKGEAEHHRLRDERHQCAEAQQAEQPLEQTGEKGQQQDQGDEALAADVGQGADAGEQHDGDGRRWPADQMPGRAPQAGDDYRHDGRIQAVLCRQPGNQRIGQRLRQRQDGPGQADQGIVAEGAPVDPWQPAQERQQRLSVR